MRLLTAICPSVGSEDRSGHRGLEGQHCAWDRPLATWRSGLRRLAESAITRHLEKSALRKRIFIFREVEDLVLLPRLERGTY